MRESELLINTRIRVVWDHDDVRRMKRFAAFVLSRGDQMRLRCGTATCPAPDITVHKDDSDPVGRVLRCGCTDRVLARKA